MSWQLVGTKTDDHVVRNVEGTDHYFFEFNRSEGHIKIHYTISKRPVAGGNIRCRLNFDQIEVIDDKEIGSGDWRITTRLNGFNCSNSPEEHWSVGSGSEEDLYAFRTVTIAPHAHLFVYCRVHEEDS
jgi:hypothetical protein